MARSFSARLFRRRGAAQQQPQATTTAVVADAAAESPAADSPIKPAAGDDTKGFDSKTTPLPDHASSSSAEHLEYHPSERALVWRLDLGLLVVGFLGYMFKYIDQTNISNAYVSGMKEDLNIHGNQYNYFTTYFNVGYIVMLYPSCIIISHIGPSVWLPSAEIIWGVLTCCLSTVKTPQQVFGLRFLIGLFEATAWPGFFTIISQWYMPDEISLRMSLYNIAQPTGAMLSGAMQGALSTNFEGVLGRAGWRWAFILNGACTIFIALFAYFVLPGFPEKQNPLSRWYLKQHHIDAALVRARRVNRKPQVGLTIKSFLHCFTRWQLWVFALGWPFGSNTTPSGFFNLWLKSLKNPDGTKKYSVAMLNYLPIAGQALQLVCEVIFCGLSDRLNARLSFLLLHSTISITSLIILVIRPANVHAYMAGWYLNYVGGMSTQILAAWASTNLQDDPQTRTVLFSTGTTIAYILSATVPLAAYPASQAPNWKIGAKLYLGFAFFAASLFISIHYLLRWDAKKKAQKQAQGGGVEGQVLAT